MPGEVFPEPAAEMPGEGRLTGANRVQQLYHGHVGMPDGALQIDPRPDALRVVVAQPLPRIGQRVGPILAASQESSGDEMIQHPDERIGRYSETGGELRPQGHSRGDRIRDPQRRRHPHRHRRDQVGRWP